MNATTLESRRERMTSVLDALGFGLTQPVRCGDCRPLLAEKCERCTERNAAVKLVTDAVIAVEDAGTEDEALHAYQACLLGLVG